MEHDVVGSRLAETLEIELFDKPGQWQFPRLLLVIIDLAQFRRVQPELSGHLYPAVARRALAQHRTAFQTHRVLQNHVTLNCEAGNPAQNRGVKRNGGCIEYPGSVGLDPAGREHPADRSAQEISRRIRR